MVPIDSFDLYAMGLRAPRCNGCDHARLRWELGDRFLSLNQGGWVAVYELGAEPAPGQGEPQEHDGRPIRHKSSFMSVGHSDECYGWRPPTARPGPKGKKKREWLSPIKKVKRNLSRVLKSGAFGILREAWRWLRGGCKPPVETWRTLDGGVVLLAEMTHRHLVNAYEMVGRMVKSNLTMEAIERTRKVLWDEMVRRGLRRRGKAWVDGDGQPVGKGAAGRMLDGREHNEMPERRK